MNPNSLSAKFWIKWTLTNGRSLPSSTINSIHRHRILWTWFEQNYHLTPCYTHVGSLVSTTPHYMPHALHILYLRICTATMSCIYMYILIYCVLWILAGARPWRATTGDTPTSRNAIIQKENWTTKRSKRRWSCWAWSWQEGWWPRWRQSARRYVTFTYIQHYDVMITSWLL